MPMLASGVAMITSHMPTSAALPAKQRPDTIDTSGTRPLSGQRPEGRHVQPGHAGDVGVARAATAAFGEQHHRQPFSGGQVEDAVGLGVVAHALRPGQNGVVVGQPRRSLGPTDGRQARDQAVGRGVGDQVLLGAPTALRGDRQRAVLDEAARIDQVGDVLPRGATTWLCRLATAA